MITESQIKAAIRRVTAGEKPRIDLKDDGERGAGRLALIVRRHKERIATEWYAVYYRDGKRALSKVGSYPITSLADARKKFREEYAPAISAGAEPESAAARRRHRKEAGTVKELFTAYVDALKSAGRRSAAAAGCVLLTGEHNATRALGADRPAASVRPADIVAYLSEIHKRGVLVMAHATRAYISAAYSFAIKGEHDYTQKSAGTKWGVTSNPAAAIPTDPRAYRVGERFLSPAEFCTFWRWLVERDERSSLAPALRLVMATGQRVEEILRISETVYERPRAMLYWDKTKNGRPHSVPLPPQAVAILDRLIANAHGLFFAHQWDPSKPSGSPGMGEVIARFLENHPEVPKFTAKDLRRTWKTLAGDAGLSKEIRDRLQNHSRNSDVSSRHYDRYNYLPERRAAMAKWAAYLELVIAGEIKEIGERESNVVPIGKGAAA